MNEELREKRRALREKRRALNAAMEEESKKEKLARYVEKQQEKEKAILKKDRHYQYRRDAALEALQVNTISAASNLIHILMDSLAGQQRTGRGTESNVFILLQP
jgi:5-methylcytosine-specific restriction endonuclease McrA